MPLFSNMQEAYKKKELVLFQPDFRRVQDNINAAIQREEERHGEAHRLAAVSPKYTPMAPPASSVVQVNRYMSLVVIKAVFRVFDLMPHKPSCTATEDG